MAGEVYTSDLLLSEVHLETLTSPGQTIWLTEYVIMDDPDLGNSGSAVDVDQDGDLVLPRRQQGSPCLPYAYTRYHDNTVVLNIGSKSGSESMYIIR